MSKPIRLIILDDSRADSALIRRELHKAELDAEFQCVDTKEEFLDALNDPPPDLLIADYKLPGFDGLSAIALARQRFPDLPAIVVSGTIGEEAAVEVLKSGATDYVLKERLGRLVPSVRRALAEARALAERKEAEAALRESQERLAGIVKAAMDAIITVDEQQRVVLFNPAAEKMFRCPAREALGSPLDRFIPGRFREAHRQHVQRFGQDGQTSRSMHSLGTLYGLRQDGQEFPVEASISHLSIGGHRLFSAIVRDITERKQAEEARQEEARRKDDFLAVLSHELRNPLAPIRYAAQMMRHAVAPASSPATSVAGDSELMERACAIIERQVSHMVGLLGGLLDVSRITRGKIELQPEELDLVEVVRSVVADYRPLFEGNRVALEAEMPPAPLLVEADKARVIQIVGNVLHNALKFTDAGSKVGIAVRSEEGGFARVSVTDSGPGIRREMLLTIFEPFMQARGTIGRSRGGLGLGLALVKGLVELHGGTVAAHSDGPGTGCEIVVRLPLPSAEEFPLTRSKPVACPLIASPRRILIVEDNADAAESLQILLQMAGHNVAVASDGETSLETARAFAPEIVLCDIGLPGELDGYDVARHLRKMPHLKHVYLAALTGFGQTADKTKAREAGFDTHITKPIDPYVLEQMLAVVPNRSSSV